MDNVIRRSVFFEVVDYSKWSSVQLGITRSGFYFHLITVKDGWDDSGFRRRLPCRSKVVVVDSDEKGG